MAPPRGYGGAIITSKYDCECEESCNAVLGRSRSLWGAIVLDSCPFPARRLLGKHPFSSAPLPDVNCLRFAAPAEATWRLRCSEAQQSSCLNKTRFESIFGAPRAAQSGPRAAKSDPREAKSGLRATKSIPRVAQEQPRAHQK